MAVLKRRERLQRQPRVSGCCHSVWASVASRALLFEVDELTGKETAFFKSLPLLTAQTLLPTPANNGSPER